MIGGGAAELFEQDPAGTTAGDFLVAGHGVEEGFRGCSVVLKREAGAGEEVVLALLDPSVDEAEPAADGGGAGHADGDGFAVQIALVTGGGLDGVGDGVAVIEDGA